MTIKEAILSYPGVGDLESQSPNHLSKILVDRSVASDGAATYSIDEKETVALCAADALVALVNLPDFSEGKLSQKMPRGFILATAAGLYRDNGETENANRISPGYGAAKEKWW